MRAQDKLGAEPDPDCPFPQSSFLTASYVSRSSAWTPGGPGPSHSGSAYPELERVQLSFPWHWNLFLCLLPVCCHSTHTCLRLRVSHCTLQFAHLRVCVSCLPVSSGRAGTSVRFCVPSSSPSPPSTVGGCRRCSVSTLMNGACKTASGLLSTAQTEAIDEKH